MRTIPVGPARGLRMEIDFRDQAREGYHTLLLARLSGGGRVLAFGADPTEHAACSGTSLPTRRCSRRRRRSSPASPPASGPTT